MKIHKLFLCSVFSCAMVSTVAQVKNCEELDVKLEVTKEESSGYGLKITIEDVGNYKIRMIDMNGEVQQLKERSIRNLRKGEYDIIIIDQANKDRCPFSKRIKIEGQ